MAELHGRHVQALDLAERLIPDLSLNEALLWPPDLFAYTSYALTFTAAYQLVVSLPSGKRWQPPKDELASWLYEDAEANLNSWFAALDLQQPGVSPVAGRRRLAQDTKTRSAKSSRDIRNMRDCRSCCFPSRSRSTPSISRRTIRNSPAES